MKKFFNFFLIVASCLISTSAFSETVRTEICIENKSPTTYSITGVDVDSYDWEDYYDNGAMNRPDHNWVDKQLGPSETKCELADVNRWALRIGFSFSVTRPGLSEPTKTRMRAIYEKIIQVDFDFPDHWDVSQGGSAPVNTPGRLSMRHACLGPKDSEATSCSRFIIEK